MNRRLFSFASLLLILAFLQAFALTQVDPFVAQAQQSSPGTLSSSQQAPASTSAPDAIHTSPVMFIENTGQWTESARFKVWGATAGTTWLAKDAIWLAVIERPVPDGSPFDPERTNPLPTGEPRLAVAIKLSLIGANPHPVLEPFDRLDTTVSYFLGNDPAQWRSDVPVWGGVRYVDLYPGIDLELTGDQGGLAPRLVARPGADLGVVRLRVEGAGAVTVDGGVLRLSTAAGDAAWPLLRTEGLSAGPAILSLDQALFEVAAPFSAISHAPSPQDNPADLLYGTFLAGGYSESGAGIAVDGSGATYITGSTWSWNFPITEDPFDGDHNGNSDVFVLKLNSEGSALEYATFLGGAVDDSGAEIVLDASGAAYITGSTESFGFPTTPDAFDTSRNGDYFNDAFAAKLDAEGSALIYSTFLGGVMEDFGQGIALDGSGAAYITGYTSSSEFPTTPGAFDTTYNGDENAGDAFVIKLNADGSDLLYGTFLGGGSMDRGIGIAADGSGAAFVTGLTCADDFPATPGAFDTSFNSLISTIADAFVVKLDPAGSALDYATYLGGTSSEQGNGIALDGSGAVYVTGSTSSTDFPTTPGAFDITREGGDAFVVKLTADGSALHYSTFLGGSDYDAGWGIALDGTGRAHLTGYTKSTDLPTTSTGFDRGFNGGLYDAFVLKLDATGSSLAYGTYAGGSDNDYGNGIAVDGNGVGHITGSTFSDDFPTTPDALQGDYYGSRDAYLVRLALEEISYDYSVYLPIVPRNG